MGKREGRQEGLDEGKRQGKQEAILQLLSLRGLAVSAALRAQVLACTDAPTLDQHLARAATARSAEEILGHLPLIGG